jgi:hypothetical protein
MSVRFWPGVPNSKLREGQMVKYMRDGIKVWPYCSDCGCRLNITKGPWESEYRLTHFGLSGTVDARGCKCPKLFRLQIVGKDKVAEFI